MGSALACVTLWEPCVADLRPIAYEASVERVLRPSCFFPCDGACVDPQPQRGGLLHDEPDRLCGALWLHE